MDDVLLLLVGASTLAILHTLVPDHELPLAMIGRAQRWSIKRMCGFTCIAGIIHISISMAIGVLALFVSYSLAGQIAGTAAMISGFMLIGFGSIYAVLGWRRKGHGHKHGSKYAAHAHGCPPPGSGVKLDSEGKPVFGGATWLAAIVGMAPCFTLIPVLFQAIWYGTTVVLATMVVYAVSTISMMMITASLMLKTITFLTKMQKIEKYIEVIAGLIILAVGLYVIIPALIQGPHVH